MSTQARVSVTRSPDAISALTSLRAWLRQDEPQSVHLPAERLIE
jgi:hypothetical protein